MARLWSVLLRFALPHFQFRLQSLLIGTTIVAAALAPVRAELARCRQIEHLVKEISTQGGEIFFDYQEIEEGGFLSQLKNSQPSWVRAAFGEYVFSHVVAVQFTQQTASAGFLAEIARLCPYVKSLALRDARVGDEALAPLANCKSLRILELSQNCVTDAGLRHIASLPELETLCLERTLVKGECFGELAKLKNLRVLAAPQCPVGDEQIAKLAASESLEMLFLADTEISDASIEHLARMKRLNTLSISGTQISTSGRERLRLMRPDISVF